ncbi:hypothetical protein BGX23_006981 [Mortierella sp. AD031]|nr:hypothetical protein BGX23_006981 [Mortierella sp. AD031]
MGAYGAVVTTTWQGTPCAIKVQDNTRSVSHRLPLCDLIQASLRRPPLFALWPSSLIPMTPLPRPAVKKLAHDVAQGVKALHTLKYVHNQ